VTLVIRSARSSPALSLLGLDLFIGGPDNTPIIVEITADEAWPVVFPST
jgi:hypothetical protein